MAETMTAEAETLNEAVTSFSAGCCEGRNMDDEGIFIRSEG